MTEIASHSGSPSPQLLGAPGTEDMELPSSYSKIKGSKFAHLIMNGCFQIVKGGYFEDQWQRQEKFEMRQRVPDAFKWDGETAVKLWAEFGPRFMIAISYAWLDELHPDPNMFNLQRLANAIRAHKKAHAGELKDKDVGIIHTCFWQKDMQDGNDMRTPEMIQQFKMALSEINTPYGHEAITCWCFQSVPSSVVRKYHDRGWTFFEKLIINGKGLWPTDPNLLVVFLFNDGYDPNTITDEVLTGQMQSRMFRLDGDDKCDIIGEKGPPMTPSRFEAELVQLEKNAQEKHVKVFTNGAEDMDLVVRKYRDAYSQLTKASSFSYEIHTWKAKDMEAFVEILPDCKNLLHLELTLGRNIIDWRCVHKITNAIRQNPRLVKINLQTNQLSCSKQLALWWAWRSNQCCYVGVDCCCCCTGPWCCCNGCWCQSCSKDCSEVGYLSLAFQHWHPC